jgi:hypothetical protein
VECVTWSRECTSEFHAFCMKFIELTRLDLSMIAVNLQAVVISVVLFCRRF